MLLKLLYSWSEFNLDNKIVLQQFLMQAVRRLIFNGRVVQFFATYFSAVSSHFIARTIGNTKLNTACQKDRD